MYKIVKKEMLKVENIKLKKELIKNKKFKKKLN